MSWYDGMHSNERAFVMCAALFSLTVSFITAAVTVFNLVKQLYPNGVP